MEKLENNDIKFIVNETNEIIRLCENGDVFVKGRLIENDKELVDAMREFMTHASFTKE